MQHILHVSCEVSNLGCEYFLLVLQAVTHVTLESLLQGLVSEGEDTDKSTMTQGQAYEGERTHKVKIKDIQQVLKGIKLNRF